MRNPKSLLYIYVHDGFWNVNPIKGDSSQKVLLNEYKNIILNQNATLRTYDKILLKLNYYDWLKII